MGGLQSRLQYPGPSFRSCHAHLHRRTFYYGAGTTNTLLLNLFACLWFRFQSWFLPAFCFFSFACFSLLGIACLFVCILLHGFFGSICRNNEHTLRHLTIEETEKIKPAHSQEQANPEIPAAQRPSTIQRSVRLALCISLVWAYPLDSSRRQKQLT